MQIADVKKVDPEEVVRRYIYAKDNHEWDQLVTLLAPDCTSSDPSVPEPVKGIKAISQYFPMLEQVGMKTEILTMMSKGNDVAAELAVTCTINEGDKPRSFTVKLAKFYRVNSKGLLADEREYSDTAAKFRALGDDAASAFQSIGRDTAPEAKRSGEKTPDETGEVAAGDLTPKSIFATRIPANLKRNLDKIASVNAICQFNVTGDTGGSWYVDMTVRPPTVVAGTSDQAKCTITCTDKVLVGIVSGKINATMAVITGKVKIAGDMGVAGVLRMIIQ
jgi:limonene-1,2-epoxide hydrolase